MSDRLTEAAAQELERAVTGIAKQMLAFLPTLPQDVEEVSIPNIGIAFDPRQPAMHISARKWVIKALAARFWASQQRPDLPLLPLSDEDIERMQDDPDPLLSEWGWYGSYLRAGQSSWDIRNRLEFDDGFRDLLRRLNGGKPSTTGRRVVVDVPSDLTKPPTLHFSSAP